MGLVRTRLLLIAALLAMPGAARAADEDAQLWLQAGASVDLGGPWRLANEANIRFSDERGGLYEVENNLLLGYRLNEKVTLWAGYTHDPQYAGGGRFSFMERRAREQATLDDIAIGPGTLDLRMRAEQRWRDGVDGTGWRLRPALKYALPLGGKAELLLSHESFINLNRMSFQRRTGYERMRNAVSVKVPISGGLSGEIGYLNQYGIVSEGPDRMDHAATAALSLSL